MKYFVPVILALFVFQLSSCKDDEIPPSIISFATQNSTVSEDVGNASVKVILDKASSDDLVIGFTIEGSAQSGLDYESIGNFTIPKGAIEGVLLIKIIDDTEFEFDPELTSVLGETLEITLSSVTGNGRLSESPNETLHKLIIKENDQEPYIKIDLSWKDLDKGNAGDVDMDLLFWFEPNPGTDEFLLGPSEFQVGTTIGTQFESLSLSSFNPDTNYGLTFLYYEGSATNLEFTVRFTVFGGTMLNGLTEVTYSGNYTLNNLNGDAFDEGDFQIEQSYVKLGLNYPTFTDITIPIEGSRGRLPKPITPSSNILKALKKP